MEEKYLSFEKKKSLYYGAGLVICFILGIGYCWSVLQTPFVQALGDESITATVALTYTLCVLCSTTSPTILGGLTRRLRTDRLVLIGAVLFGAGNILSGYVVNIAMLLFVYGIMTGVGTGLMYPTLMGYSASAFPEKQGSASGLFAGIYGGSAMIWSPVLANMIAGRGLRITFTVIGLLCLVVCVVCALIIKPVPEGYIEWKKKRSGLDQAAPGKKEDAQTGIQKVPDLNRGQMVKTSMFYVAAVTFAFGLTSGMMVISQCTQIITRTFGIEPTRAALYASLLSCMSMVGRILWGAVTDHTDKYVTLCIICAIPVATMGLLSTSPSMGITVACMALTALCYGGFGGTITPITADLFGSKYITENYGVMYFMFGIAGLIGPRVAVTLSREGSYAPAFLVGCVLAAISLAAAFIVRSKVRSSQKM